MGVVNDRLVSFTLTPTPQLRRTLELGVGRRVASCSSRFTEQQGLINIKVLYHPRNAWCHALMGDEDAGILTT